MKVIWFLFFPDDKSGKAGAVGFHTTCSYYCNPNGRGKLHPAAVVQLMKTRTCSRSLIFLLTGLRLKAVKTQKLNNSLPLSCGPSWWNLASPKLYRLAGDFCSEVCLPEPAPREEILTAGEDQYITSPACIITNVSYRPSYYVILPSQLFVYLMINRQDLCLTHL